MYSTVAKAVGVLGVAAAAVGCSLIVKDPIAALGARDVAVGTVSRAAALEDLDLLIRTLEHVHPDPYRFHSRDVLEAERRRLIDTMPASLARLDLCVRLGRL